ncbi:Membrane lipoprotein TmpC precursor [Bacillus sp. THAF10]|uniref:BMP family lipoprotein n=1 Tax=Bacillus sp. THAF10 TaxID=2587848 RepID=UPI0012678568|nr:BMP family ABC transporter substrate-binding protein [Bacillus sp. THAF10]QFT91077.1 Membrane lipoprotein TmpC precursor [Bacillus sp. THAF10]
MKKGFIATIIMVLTTMIFLVGCGTDKSNGSGSTGDGSGSDLKVGMVTDAGTIDDKSFNQGTWEGIKQAKKDFGITEKYLQPAGTTEANYMQEITNLYDADFKFIVTPGFKFETAIFQAQSQFEDAKFVLIDGSPHNGDFSPVVGENTVSIFFAEHEAGFLAGVATALELKEGEAGFIGGMEIPPVQKFNWGFQQGVAYANENLDTNVSIKAENVIYQGTFDDVNAGKQIAAAMFDRGVKVIFAAAGGVGVGAIDEAKTRVSGGEEVWMVGVDVDQYEDGKMDNGESVILTSAMKRIDVAAIDMIKAEIDGEFPGGETLTFNAENDGVGLPEENPNLSEETTKKVDEIFEMIKSGDIAVSHEQGDLIK